MVKRNELIWCPANMLLKLFLFSFLLQYSLGFDISDDEKSLFPLSSTGRDRLLAALEDKSLTGGLIAYPRLGRHVWELQQALFPDTQAGRLLVDPSSLDYDIFLNSDASSSGLDDSLANGFLRNNPQKRRNVKLIPRIGRKKRSVPDGDDKKEEAGKNGEIVRESDQSRSHWNHLNDLENDYYFSTDKTNPRGSTLYIPRDGNKRFDYLNGYEEKRAVAFTPRIGRAAFIPRIGRDDPRFRLRNRGAFVPRIGRRAALIPRIGRSEGQRSAREGAD